MTTKLQRAEEALRFLQAQGLTLNELITAQEFLIRQNDVSIEIEDGEADEADSNRLIKDYTLDSLSSDHTHLTRDNWEVLYDGLESEYWPDLSSYELWD